MENKTTSNGIKIVFVLLLVGILFSAGYLIHWLYQSEHPVSAASETEQAYAQMWRYIGKNNARWKTILAQTVLQYDVNWKRMENSYNRLCELETDDDVSRCLEQWLECARQVSENKEQYQQAVQAAVLAVHSLPGDALPPLSITAGDALPHTVVLALTDKNHEREISTYKFIQTASLSAVVAALGESVSSWQGERRILLINTAWSRVTNRLANVCMDCQIDTLLNGSFEADEMAYPLVMETVNRYVRARVRGILKPEPYWAAYHTVKERWPSVINDDAFISKVESAEESWWVDWNEEPPVIAPIFTKLDWLNKPVVSPESMPDMAWWTKPEATGLMDVLDRIPKVSSDVVLMSADEFKQAWQDWEMTRTRLQGGESVQMIPERWKRLRKFYVKQEKG